MKGSLDPSWQTQSYSQVACSVADLCYLLYDLVHVPRFLGQDSAKPRCCHTQPWLTSPDDKARHSNGVKWNMWSDSCTPSSTRKAYHVSGVFSSSEHFLSILQR
jgi:hypothetical protein